MRLGENPDTALTEVMSKVQEVRSRLPQDAEDPSIVKGTGQTFATMYLGVQNPSMTPEQITEYIERVMVPRMSTIDGVAEAEVLGGASYSMRVWIDPVRLAGQGLTASDVVTAINGANFLAAPGSTRNELVSYAITMESTLQTPEAFGQLPISGRGDDVVRLHDVARIELAAESTDTIVNFNGEPGTFIGVFPTPSANPLDTSRNVLAELPAIQDSLPDGMTVTLMYDATEQIAASINEGAAHHHRGHGDRRRDHPAVPGFRPVAADAAGGDPAVAGRRSVHPVPDGVFDQPADPAGHGSGHRSGGG
jgi:multidrug efflux pump